MGGANVFPQGVDADEVGTAWSHSSSSEESVSRADEGHEVGSVSVLGLSGWPHEDTGEMDSLHDEYHDPAWEALREVMVRVGGEGG